MTRLNTLLNTDIDLYDEHGSDEHNTVKFGHCDIVIAAEDLDLTDQELDAVFHSLTVRRVEFKDPEDHSHLAIYVDREELNKRFKLLYPE